MTDDVIVSGGTVTFRQNLWKRVVQILCCLLCLAIGLALALLLPPDAESRDMMRILGLVMVLAAVYLVYAVGTKSRTVLVASAEGIMPMYLAPEKRTLIRWSNIERMEKVVQTVKGNKTSHLALYLKEPLEAQDPNIEMMRRVVGRSMSDGAMADVYIQDIMLPEKVEKVIERLERVRAGDVRAGY